MYTYFVKWEKQQVAERIVDTLRRRIRIREGSGQEPAAAIGDSRSVRAAPTAGAGTAAATTLNSG